MAAAMRLRPGAPADLPILEAMLFEAFHWRAGRARPSLAGFREEPEFRKLLEAWGERAGDAALVAESGGEVAGAAWYRFWTPECHSYGFVDAATPELAMAVAAGHRSRGVGRALLRGLVDVARQRGVARLSLSVDPENHALALYRSIGFRTVGTSGTSLTLLLDVASEDAC